MQLIIKFDIHKNFITFKNNLFLTISPWEEIFQHAWWMLRAYSHELHIHNIFNSQIIVLRKNPFNSTQEDKQPN